MSEGARGPVTVVIARAPAPGREDALAAWCHEVVALASSQQGHLGAGVLRPDRPGGEWVIVARYASQDDLDRWRASPALAEALARVAPIAAGAARVVERHGLEPFFDAPGIPASPPRWKMAIATWLAIYPLALTLGALTTPLLGGAPLALRTLATTVILVPLMTWVVMPALTRALRPWLFRG